MRRGYLDGIVLIVLAVMALPVLGLIIVGLSLMFADRKRRPPHPTCGACAYDLSGSLGETTTCPECGSPFAVAGVQPAGTGQRSVRFLVGVGLLLAGVAAILLWGLNVLIR
jgi:hypothetical protein